MTAIPTIKRRIAKLEESIVPPTMIAYSIARLIEPGALVPPTPMSLNTVDGLRFDRAEDEAFDTFIARVLAETGEGVILFDEVNRDDEKVISMLYSGRHCEALRAAYLRIFGVPVPEDVLRKAADHGTLYKLMAAIDLATDTRQPIEDWQQHIE